MRKPEIICERGVGVGANGFTDAHADHKLLELSKHQKLTLNLDRRARFGKYSVSRPATMLQTAPFGIRRRRSRAKNLAWPLSSTLRILGSVAERFGESLPEGGRNFHAIGVEPGH